jgi:hypothetical protein
MASTQRSYVVAVVALVAVAVGTVGAPAAGAGLGGPGDAHPAGAGIAVPGVGPQAGTALGAQGAGPTAPGADDALGQAVDPDSVRMTVALQPDGDARWTVTYRVLLSDDNETAAFESLRDDVRANPGNYTSRFGDRMRSTARVAENATGREMAVRNVSVTAEKQELGRSYGILEYTFEWTSFAVVDGDTVRAGDAVAGLFLDGKTTLVVRWPEGYGLVTARPDPTPSVGDDRSVGWAGPVDFQSDEPVVVVREGAGDGGGDGGASGLPTSALAAVAVVAVGLLAAVAWYRRGETAAAGDGADAPDGTGGSGDTGGTDGEPPEELLSNEEKVLKLVEERGGRLKQQEVVQELGWTEAKTSQVVRDLRDAGDLEGFRLGRENVLRLPEESEDGDDG